MKLYEKVVAHETNGGKLALKASFKAVERNCNDAPAFRAHLDVGGRLVAEGRLDPSEVETFVKWLTSVYLEDDDVDEGVI